MNELLTPVFTRVHKQRTQNISFDTHYLIFIARFVSTWIKNFVFGNWNENDFNNVLRFLEISRTHLLRKNNIQIEKNRNYIKIVRFVEYYFFCCTFCYSYLKSISDMDGFIVEIIEKMSDFGSLERYKFYRILNKNVNKITQMSDVKQNWYTFCKCQTHFILTVSRSVNSEMHWR